MSFEQLKLRVFAKCTLEEHQELAELEHDDPVGFMSKLADLRDRYQIGAVSC